jgi:hypothetical protein
VHLLRIFETKKEEEEEEEEEGRQRRHWCKSRN